jgi:hypothetical protein
MLSQFTCEELFTKGFTITLIQECHKQKIIKLNFKLSNSEGVGLVED